MLVKQICDQQICDRPLGMGMIGPFEPRIQFSV